jgi:hypothetical protein
MGTINVGEIIKIPCEVKPGPFSDEKFISFETLDGIVSGFVAARDLQEKDHHFFVSGVVREIKLDQIVVIVRGSFFQTNGIATLSKSVACAA